MLAELAVAKERDEEILKMHQQTIDRFILNQRRVDALLVQNYELHEYPIPRRFVILPDSYERWDSRKFLMERFRLHLLWSAVKPACQVPTKEKSSDQLGIANATSTIPIPVKSSIHLAKHDGYELSRPTEYFDQYGHYVLGMLRILRHCLAIATVVVSAVALVDNSVKDIMDGVKTISERTIEAVDMSIDLLEQKLGESAAADRVEALTEASTQEEDMLGGLAALEGADLRRLDPYLRKKDEDKILGNLYRITTETGHEVGMSLSLPSGLS